MAKKAHGGGGGGVALQPGGENSTCEGSEPGEGMARLRKSKAELHWELNEGREGGREDRVR